MYDPRFERGGSILNTYAAFMMGGDAIITLTNGEKLIGRIIDVTDEEIVLKSTKTSGKSGRKKRISPLSKQSKATALK
jgi:hypothetical protein